MRSRTPIIVALIAFLAACGGDSALQPASEVVTLDDGDLKTLCTQFVTEACSSAESLEMCLADCVDVCSRTDTPALMRQECITPITVADVQECASAVGRMDENAFSICVDGMGGCVFDVLDLSCQ